MPKQLKGLEAYALYHIVGESWLMFDKSKQCESNARKELYDRPNAQAQWHAQSVPTNA